MSKAEAFLTALGLLILGLIIYGLFVYNNNQNIQRDEFYASHCKMVDKQIDVFSDKYTCKG